MSYPRTKTHRERMKLAKRNTVKYWKSGGEFKQGNVPWNVGVHHSEATKRKIGLKSKGGHYGIGAYGEDNPAWNGGFSALNKRIRETFAYLNWRNSIFKRDRYTCRLCRKRGEFLQADHYPKTFAWLLRKFKITSTRMATSTKELWKLKRGRTLCLKCHRKTPTYAKHL